MDCEEPQKGCPDCPVNNTCQVIVKHWFLTEKGRAAIAAPGPSTIAGVSTDLR